MRGGCSKTRSTKGQDLKYDFYNENNNIKSMIELIEMILKTQFTFSCMFLGQFWMISSNKAFISYIDYFRTHKFQF